MAAGDVVERDDTPAVTQTQSETHADTHAETHGHGHGTEIVAAKELRYGEALMPDGRISAAREHTAAAPTSPFSAGELASLDDALTLSSRETGLSFSVYLGDLGTDSRAQAEALHASIGDAATDAVLVAVSPGQRVLEIVTGEEAHRRLSDRSCKLAVMTMTSSFEAGDLAGGLVAGLRKLTEQAGAAHHR